MIKFKVKTKDAQLRVRAKLSFDENIGFAELDAFSRKLIKGFLRSRQIKKRVIEFTGPIGISIYSRLQRPISKHDFFLIMEQVVDSVQKLNKNSFSINNNQMNISNNNNQKNINVMNNKGFQMFIRNFFGNLSVHYQKLIDSAKCPILQCGC